MALTIERAILHIIGGNGGAPRFSSGELDIDSETCHEFITKHIRRLMNSPAARKARFLEGSEVHALIGGYQRDNVPFGDVSRRLCERLASLVEPEDDSPVDLLIAICQNKGERYLALVLLSCGECFTHKLSGEAENPENHIVKNTAVLSSSSGSVGSACLIPLDTGILRVYEKNSASGDEESAFCGEFLQCETELSRKEAADIVKQIVEEVGAKHFAGDVEAEAMLKSALLEEAELDTGDGLNLTNVAKRAFPEREEAIADFVAKTKEYGLPYEVDLDKPMVKRTFGVQKFQADNGVELSLPAELIRDSGSVQITTMADGTISITLRNLRRQG